LRVSTNLSSLAVIENKLIRNIVKRLLIMLKNRYEASRHHLVKLANIPTVELIQEAETWDLLVLIVRNIGVHYVLADLYRIRYGD
jgi:hypothetical protein